MSRLGGSKMQSSPGADNARYADGIQRELGLCVVY